MRIFVLNIMFLSRKKYGRTKQFIISILLIVFTSGISYVLKDFLSYQIVALVLLLAVSILAIMFEIVPVMVAAIFSAVVLNFVFIEPTFTFRIEGPEATLMFLMYFVVALINAVLSNKIRRAEKTVLESEERANTIKLYDTMLNSLSHELRTPISTIIGATDTLLENELKISEENKHELIKEIGIAGFRLNRQVENLLNMSKLEAGVLKPSLDWTDLNELIFKIIANQKNKYHRIRFEPNTELPLVKIDKVLLEHIIGNLLHNAIEHTPVNTLIEIQVSCLADYCTIVIQDNGTGFPKDTIKYVFDKFYRLPDSAAGGTGLGLSIAKGFTECLNGSIKLENRKTGGAKFTLTIPVESSSITELRDE